MISFQLKAKVVRKEKLASDLFRLTLHAPDIAEAAKPGQFVMIRATTEYDPLLRRPFSIHQVMVDGHLQIFFKVVGRGTRLLSSLEVNQYVDLIGPLGRGFEKRPGQPVCLLGGGVGIAPLLFCAKELLKTMEPHEIIVLLGARTRTEVEVVADDFSQMGLAVRVATDDGSMGHHGIVTDLMQPLEKKGTWVIYACGPYPMMKVAAEKCKILGWECQVSLETMMACGVAACLGCATEKQNGSGYVHVCKDGPVFQAEEVKWQ
jgi:dihydroorotate dehydrogenase electron transfer subunit